MFSDPLEGGILQTIATSLKETFSDVRVVDVDTLGDENVYLLKSADRVFTVTFPATEDLFSEMESALEVGVSWDFNAAGHLTRSI